MNIQDISKEQAKWIYEHALQSISDASICFIQVSETNDLKEITDILYKHSIININAGGILVFMVSREFLNSLYHLVNPIEQKETHIHRIDICLN